ncbi:hypothetical protein R1sor_023295 [Riccia sorocarpa]|uniref:Ubiquinol oxidase n=1 Tax=Riccia sorocarpa TaxID=122646 RepID=A0ABD3GPG8_9MARC
MGNPATLVGTLSTASSSLCAPHFSVSVSTGNHRISGSSKWSTLRSLGNAENLPLRTHARELVRRRHLDKAGVAVCVVRNKDTVATNDDGGNGKIVGQEVENHQSPSVRIEEKSVDDSAVHDTASLPRKFEFDYGFQAKFLRSGPTVPGNVLKLALENFGREWRALRRKVLFSELTPIRSTGTDAGPTQLIGAYAGRGLLLFLRGLDKFLTFYDGLQEIQPLKKNEANAEQDDMREKLKQLKLDSEKVWERERSREQVEAPWWIFLPYYLLCGMLDIIFDNRPIQRFWFLETVARMPYFSFISMLHLYETLGWWRIGAEVRKVHFAEEWNEMHHLKIMESLGGDLEWGDRFFAQHAAFFYYWVLNGMFLISPKVAYNFSELLESHAVDTYSEFCDENEELLKSLPPSPVAVEYYESGDLYMYDEFQTSRPPESRRPKMDSLYDVFQAISGDEAEHVKTMVACQRLDRRVESPNRIKYNSKNKV